MNDASSKVTAEHLRRGAYLDNERLAPCEITPLKSSDNPWFVVTLHQGRNQQIRRKKNKSHQM